MNRSHIPISSIRRWIPRVATFGRWLAGKLTPGSDGEIVRLLACCCCSGSCERARFGARFPR